MPTFRRSRAELEAQLSRTAASLAPDAEGPVALLSSEPLGAGLRCEISARRLVAVAPEMPELRDVYVAVPVSGSVEVDADGRVARATLAEPDEEALREARAFARGLVEEGCVRGVAPATAPRRASHPARPTHELRSDAQGRRVIRRIGFAGA